MWAESGFGYGVAIATVATATTVVEATAVATAAMGQMAARQAAACPGAAAQKQHGGLPEGNQKLCYTALACPPATDSHAHQGPKLNGMTSCILAELTAEFHTTD